MFAAYDLCRCIRLTVYGILHTTYVVQYTSYGETSYVIRLTVYGIRLAAYDIRQYYGIRLIAYDIQRTTCGSTKNCSHSNKCVLYMVYDAKAIYIYYVIHYIQLTIHYKSNTMYSTHKRKYIIQYNTMELS